MIMKKTFLLVKPTKYCTTDPLLQENYPIFGKLLKSIFLWSLALFLFSGAELEMLRVGFAGVLAKAKSSNDSSTQVL